MDEDALPTKPGTAYEKLNWLQAGILTADKLLTVSPNYATEIAEDDEKGVELSQAIRQGQACLAALVASTLQILPVPD